MAQGSKEHRMVFDIRGRRRYVVKVVYALLAILMAASLFLVTGAINLNSIFGTASSGESATKSFEEQATRIEAKLAKTPEDEDLLLNLTRTRVNIANSMITNGAGESEADLVQEVKQELAQMSEDWSKYLKVADEPSPGLAIQVQPALFQVAELSSSSAEAMENLVAANEAQEILAESPTESEQPQHACDQPGLRPGIQSRQQNAGRSGQTGGQQVCPRIARKSVRRSRKKRPQNSAGPWKPKKQRRRAKPRAAAKKPARTR